MAAKLTITSTVTQAIERESFSEKNFSQASLSDLLAEFELNVDVDAYYINRYEGCYVLSEKQGYSSISIWYDI